MTAARYYRRALDQNPGNPPIWVQYGHALKESGSLSRAEDAYRKSLELDGDVADTHLQLGHALKIQGRKIEASAAYLSSLFSEPQSPHVRQLHDGSALKRPSFAPAYRVSIEA